jgi:hypothetical protein
VGIGDRFRDNVTKEKSEILASGRGAGKQFPDQENLFPVPFLS